MKPILKLSAFILSAIVFFNSCQKKFLCPDCDTNKPPIANAGLDQAIVLPKDSVLLDGSSSVDADGTIISYKWIKISGPVSSNILSVESAKSSVTTLLMGVYKFELTVTDNGGLSAKDTVQVIVDDPKVNQPPVANAGADQIIILPTNSLTLNGGNSTDPENNITNYAWTKISGPSSFTIVDPNLVQTQIINLVQGNYQFELKVTDNGGLTAKDTMQVVVNNPSLPDTCADNRTIINAQLTLFGTLSSARNFITVASAGNKILFAEGQTYSGAPSSVVDIYDLSTQSWSTAQISIARSGVVAISAGNKIYLAGGYSNGNHSSRVDIYDAVSNSWTTAELSEPRDRISVGTIGSKIMFAGGDNSCISNGRCTSDRVDIYDTLTNTWSVASLSLAREGMSATVAANKIYFAGGHDWRIGTGVFDKIDIYDNSTNTWSTSNLIQRKAHHGSVVIGNYILWAGGEIWNNINDYETTCVVEKRDLINGTSAILHLSSVSKDKEVTTLIKNGSIVFFSGYNKFDIYNVSTNTWSIGVLPIDISDGASIISVNNIVYVAGGNINGVLTDKVWKVEF